MKTIRQGANVKSSQFTGSVFTNRIASKPYAFITLWLWIEGIRSGVYKEAVLAYREFLAKGEKEMAHSTKHALDCFICRGRTPMGRKESDPIEEENDLVMVDYDRHDFDWSAERVQFVKQFLWVVAAYQSISGGLRLFVLMPHADVKFYKVYVKVVLAEVDRVVGCDHDPACDHRMRMTLPSYDEQAWCRAPEEELEAFPVSPEGLAAIQKQVDRLNRPKLEEGDIDCSRLHFTGERHFTQNQILEKMDAWMKISPYVENQHHDSLLMAGSMARYEGFTPDDLSEMAKLIRKRFPVTGYDLKEVLRNLIDGFNRPGKYASTLRHTRRVAAGYDDEAYDEEDMRSNEEIIDATCPYFGEEVYGGLPDVILSLLVGVRQKRQRDMLTASIMAALSAVMANVKCYYRDHVYSANLAFCAVAKAGSGKGICKESRKLLEGIQDEYDAAYQQAYAEYKEKLRQWNADRQKAAKAGEGFPVAEPKEPKPVNFISSEVTSLSRFIDDQVNSPHGGILFVEELAVYNNNERTENGGLTATHRKVMMNENVSKNFINCGKVEVKNPKSSYVFTGTQTDFDVFVRNVQEGTLSRLAVLTGESQLHWERLDPSTYNRTFVAQSEQRYKAAAQYVLELFHFLQKYPTDIFFPEEKLDEFNSFFEYATEMIKDSKAEHLSSLVFRAPINCLRIGAILTCMRKFEARDTTRDLDMHPDDFDTALAMTQVFLRHAAQYSTILTSTERSVKKMHSVSIIDRVFEELPDVFRAKEAEVHFKAHGVGHTTAYKYMGLWVEDGKATKDNGTYTKCTAATDQSAEEKAD